ncbi:alpha/beta-hydrolase [Apiospora saccharicola]|uniref:Alpha/beta-hydrolase n=1 Tax=Apiospora saccharicola TaxID=335842 RepID=A0ABR1UMS4_9PEZI
MPSIRNLTLNGLAMATLCAGVFATVTPRIELYGSSAAGLTWGACPPMFPPPLECANYTVPLDWNHPEGNETVQLGMVRLAATAPSERIGPLFMNPGGPGRNATRMVADLARWSRLDSRIRRRFDIIGLDPRGVGLSTPLRCDAAIYNQPKVGSPTPEAAFDDLVARNRAIGESCRAKSGRLIDFMDTVSAAKDHEAVRKAVGGEKASFFGGSYGTQLFATYAHLFPHSVRAMALDSILLHSKSATSNVRVDSTAFGATLKHFFAQCKSNPDCALYGEDGEALFSALLDWAEKTPIPAPGCVKRYFRWWSPQCHTELSDGDILSLVHGLLAEPRKWSGLSQALARAIRSNDATLLSKMGPLPTAPRFAGRAVLCQDWERHGSSTSAELQALHEVAQRASPLTRGASNILSFYAGCVGWPANTTNPPSRLEYKGQTPMLLVSARYDPLTSYEWAVGLQQELGGDDRAVLLTRDGAGHGSFFDGGEAMRRINAYLLDLVLPEPGTVVES